MEVGWDYRDWRCSERLCWSLDPPITVDFPKKIELGDSNSSSLNGGGEKPCAAVEEMGKDFEAGVVGKETLRVRRIIEDHFDLNGSYLF